MPLTYEIIEKLMAVIPGYNVRALTLADFEALCARDGIVALVHRMPARGWYFVKDDVPFIVINNRLSAGHRAFVGFHEYFHHRFHPGGHHHYTAIGIKDRIEREASTMAAVAVVPTAALETRPRRRGISRGEVRHPEVSGGVQGQGLRAVSADQDVSGRVTTPNRS